MANSVWSRLDRFPSHTLLPTNLATSELAPSHRVWLIAVLALVLIVPSTRAVSGGAEANAEAFPWVVALLDGQGSTPGSGYFCAGVLIHPSWVMTAAHCVADRTTNEFEVALGVDRLSGATAGIQRAQVAEMFFHPRYLFRDGQHDGDIALLRLATPVMDREPLRFFERNVVPGQGEFFALGWSHSTPDRSLVTLPMSVLTRVEASQATGEGFWLDAVPVYSGAENLGLCYGDSGAPLVVRENGEPRLLGVASYVVGGCTGYAVFGNLQFYRDWIVSHVFPGFDEWRQSNQIDTLWGDEDGDGLSNYAEFARVSDPRQPTPLNFGVEPFLRADHPAVEFSHHLDAAFRVELSRDLMLWETLPSSQVVARAALPGEQRAERVTVESSLSLDDHPRQFLRILSLPHSDLARPARSAFREFYLKGDAALLRQDGQFEQRYHVTDLIDGTTTFKFFTPVFSPRLRLIDRDTGDTILDEGTEGVHTLVSQTATQAGKAYELVLSSVNPTDTGTFTFHYPQLLELPQNLEIGRQAIQGVLNDFSNFDGNFYYRAYQILGAVAGHTVTITLRSDPELGGFRPYLSILNEQLETVVETQGAPETETSLTFTLEPAQKYFAFATTLTPGEQGLFTLSGRRVR